MFTTNIDLWCFSFVTLFNLQGTRPSASAAERTLSYHVVRLLSSTFFNFFEVFSALNAAFRRSLRQLIYFTRAAWVCQALFSLRSKFFRSQPQRFRRFSDSLNILSKLSWIVKNFFCFVKNFFALDAGTTAAFQTACLLYQTHPPLSTLFFKIFPLFFRLRQRHFAPSVI